MNVGSSGRSNFEAGSLNVIPDLIKKDQVAAAVTLIDERARIPANWPRRDIDSNNGADADEVWRTSDEEQQQA
jgi:hypothetical protein